MPLNSEWKEADVTNVYNKNLFLYKMASSCVAM